MLLQTEDVVLLYCISMMDQITTLTIANLFRVNYRDNNEIEENYNLFHTCPKMNN